MSDESSGNDADGRDYPVGHGKPPKHSRWKKGQSGNPKGRSKGSLNFETHVQNALNETVVINENGKRKKISKRQAAAKQFANKAASGDPKAIGLLLNQATVGDGTAGPRPDDSAPLPEDDRLVLGHLFERIRNSEPFEDALKPATEGEQAPQSEQIQRSDENDTADQN